VRAPALQPLDAIAPDDPADVTVDCEAAALVLHRHAARAGVESHRNLDAVRAGVAGDVLQPLLHFSEHTGAGIGAI
jgi:hypothetical protein